MPIVSIIIPVYNVDKYLCQCIDSVLIQTVKDFELLLINDGSTDSSGEICNEYALKDSRISVFHKKNGGVGSARNLGLDNVKGKWLTFIDSDDWIEEKYLENLLANNDQADLRFLGYSTIQKENIFDYKLEKGSHKKDFNRFFEEHISSYLIKTPWGKLFKRDLIEQYAIRFNERISIGEDTLFNFTFLKHSSEIFTSDYVGYNWRLEVSDSLTRSTNVKKWLAFLEEYKKTILPMIKQGFNILTIKKDWGVNCFMTVEKLYNDTAISKKQRIAYLLTIYNYLDEIDYKYYKVSNTKFHKVLSYIYGINTNVKIAFFLYSLLFGIKKVLKSVKLAIFLTKIKLV